MRLELELHYDEVFREEWGDRQEQNADKGAAPRRPGASRIQYRVMECLRHRRYETLGLPDELRRVLRHPRQEKSSTVVEEVADVLRMLCCKGRQIAVRHQHELEKIIADVKLSKERLLQENHACVDGVLLRGSKLIAVHAVANDIAVPQKQSGDVLTALQHSKKHLPAYITVLEDPCGTDCVIPLSSFGKKNVCDHIPAMRSAVEYLEKPFSPEDVLDLLLLDLGMVQWCGMISRWTSAGKGWTTKKKVLGATHWYLAGQRLGQHAIYDSVCAFCGSLLFGALNSLSLIHI